MAFVAIQFFILMCYHYHICGKIIVLKYWGDYFMLSGNILDYIDWRGDLTFEQAPLNEVDGLVLSLISYADFKGIVPIGMEEGITIEEAAKKYFEIRDIEKEKQARSMMRNAPEIIEKLGQSLRFKDLKLINYVDFIDEELQEQFCAVSIVLDKKTIFISYRGTDDSIVGWKEDFNMCFLEEVPAQKDALKYLEKVAEVWRGKIYLGGHSKGGNLATYAAINALYPVKKRILKVFNNDGPGFSESVIKSDKYRAISDRIHKIVPHSSVIGMLFNHDEKLTVVSSGESVAFQHNATTWDIIGDHFVYMEGLSDFGLILDKTMTVWLEAQDEETRIQSIETIFGVLETAGIKTLGDIYGDNKKSVHSLFLSYGNLDSDTKKSLGNVIKELFRTAKDVTKQELTIKERLLSIDKK